MPGVCRSRVPCHKSALGTVTATGTQSWPCLADTVPRNLLQPRKLSCQRSSRVDLMLLPSPRCCRPPSLHGVPTGHPVQCCVQRA